MESDRWSGHTQRSSMQRGRAEHVKLSEHRVGGERETGQSVDPNIPAGHRGPSAGADAADTVQYTWKAN